MTGSSEDPARPDAAPAAPDAATTRRGGRAVLAFGIVGLLVIAALLAWQIFGLRGELGTLRADLARRIAELDDAVRESRRLAGEVRDALADAQRRLEALERRVADSRSQQLALETLYQELSRNREEWTYADIEQSLTLASQQLALAGNVKAALIALRGAQSRLARLDRPALAPLRQALARDIERLEATPHVDVSALAGRLDAVIAQVDALPLAMEARPQPAAAAPSGPGPQPWWRRLWAEVRADLRSLVRVQRDTSPDAALLAPDQRYFLRENLKLRLLGARLALLARDAARFRSDLEVATGWLERYFDTRAEPVSAALAALGRLREAEIAVQAPDISVTLEAMGALRSARESRGAP